MPGRTISPTCDDGPLCPLCGKREGHAISEAKATLARRKALAFGVLELSQHLKSSKSNPFKSSNVFGATPGVACLFSQVNSQVMKSGIR